MLTFNKAAHQYFWCGEPVLNVTRIISHLVDYSRIPPAALEIARQEGMAVHRMVELDCNGEPADVPEWMKGQHEGWLRFKDETGLECWAAEQKMYHPALAYAGTPDLIGLMPKLKTAKGAACIDVKRSLYAGPAIGLQCSGYAEIWNKTQGKELRVVERFALQLRPNGTYRLQPYEDRDDWIAFLACLQQIRWKEHHYGRR